jgi:hypothetical protein
VEGYKRIPKPIFVGVFAMVSVWGILRWIGHGGERPVNRVVVGCGVIAAVVVGSCFGLALCNHRMVGDLRLRDLLLPSEVGFVLYAAVFNVLARDWLYELFYVGTSGREPASHGFEWRTLATVTVLVPLAVSWLPSAVLSTEWSSRIERVLWAVIALGCLALTVFGLVWLIGIAFAVPAALAFWSATPQLVKRSARYVAIRGSE